MEPGFLGVPGVDGLVFALLALTSGCTSFIAGVFGAAGGLLLLGGLAMVFPPTILIPIHTVVLVGDNVSRLIIMWRHVFRAALLPFFIGAALGAALGGKIFVSLPTTTLQFILGCSILVFVWMPKIAASGSMHARLGAVGFAATFIGVFVSATGTLVGPFINAACPDDRRQMIATFSAAMGIVHICKLVAFGLLGMTLAPYLPLMAAMVATASIGNLIGSRVLNRVPEKIFRAVFRVIITLLALRILWMGAKGAGYV
jgi:uncharacterized membrane protein YfcA